MNQGKWTKANFKIHHEKHPEIYMRFCKWALIATKVRNHYSAKIIFHRIRWESHIEEMDAHFKIDDGWISHYSREFMKDYPEHEGFFKLRFRENGYFNNNEEEEDGTDI